MARPVDRPIREPRRPIGESPTKKQATHYASCLVPGRMATTANRSFGPCSNRATRALQSDRTKSSTRPEDDSMTTKTTLGLTALLLAAIAGSGTAQQPINGSGKDFGRGDHQGVPRFRQEDDPNAGQSLSPDGDQPHPPGRHARRQRVRIAQRRRGAVHRLRPLASAAPSRRSSRACPTRTTRAPVVVSGVNSEPAHHDRARLQQRRRQPERERPDRPRASASR